MIFVHCDDRFVRTFAHHKFSVNLYTDLPAIGGQTDSKVLPMQFIVRINLTPKNNFNAIFKPEKL